MDIDFAPRDAAGKTVAKRKASTARTDDGTMAFSELSSTDPAATRRFLEKVFAWRFESLKFPLGEYLSFEAPGGGRGGVRPVQAKEIPGSMNYVRVDDLDGASRKIVRAGERSSCRGWTSRGWGASSGSGSPAGRSSRLGRMPRR